MSKLLARLLTQQNRSRIATGTKSCWQSGTPMRQVSTGGAGGGRTADPMKGKGPITWKSFALIATAGLGGLGFMWYVKDEKEQGEWELGLLGRFV